MCRDPQKFCGGQVSTDCLNRLGAGSMASDNGACAEQMALYRDCLSLVAGQCGAEQGAQTTPQPGSGDQAAMMAVWNEIKDSRSPAALEAFADEYPGTPLAALALDRAAALKEAAKKPEAASVPATKAAGGPVHLSPQQAVQMIQEAANREAACTKAAKAQSGDRIDAVLLDGVDDPKTQQKLASDAVADDALIAEMLDRRRLISPCEARFLEELSEIGPTMVALVARYLVTEEEIWVDLLGRRITFGDANKRMLTEAQALQRQIAALLLAAAALNTWNGGGAAEQAEAEAAVEALNAAQQRLADVAPGATVHLCAWSGGDLACD